MGLMSLNRPLFASCAALGLMAYPALGQDNPLPEGFQTEPVLRTSETRDGDSIEFPTGSPEVVSVVGTIEPGGRTPLHQHPVPTFVYVLEGELELRTEGGDAHAYSAGEAFIESMNKPHQAFNVGDSPTRILVVFMGEEGEPTTVAEGQ